MKKIIILVLSMAALAFCLTGCGTSSTNTDSTANTNDLSNTTVTGKVTAIDGNSITLQLGELTQSTTNKDNTAKSDQATSDSSDSSSNQTSSEQAPPDNSTSQNSSDKAPSGNRPPGGPMTFTAGDQTITITLGDDVAIAIEGQNTTGAIDDITVDDVLQIIFGENNTVTAITIKTLDGGHGGPGGPGSPGAPDQANNPDGSSQVSNSDSSNTTN